jgi:hypothetical protein
MKEGSDEEGGHLAYIYKYYLHTVLSLITVFLFIFSPHSGVQ